MYQNNCSVVLFLQYSPLSRDLEVIAYTEAEVYVKRPNEKHDWIYCINTHLVTGIKTKIPKEKFRNHSLPTKMVKREGNNFTLKVISFNGQVKTGHEGESVEIETKAEIIPDIELLFEKLSKCINRIRSVKADKNIIVETRKELLKATDVEINKLLEVLEIGSLVFEKDKLKCLVCNLNDAIDLFREEPTIDIPKRLIKLIGEYEQQLKEINHFEAT